MALIRTPSIILHTLPYSESSLILKAYTRENGLIALMAKGAKRPKSKFRGTLGSFSVLEFLFNEYGKGDFKILQDASLLQDYAHIKNGLLQQSLANVMMEIYLRHIYGPETSCPLFELLRNNLEALNRPNPAPHMLKLLFCDFLIQFCGILGYRPQFIKCAHCGCRINRPTSRFDIQMGGPVCRSCENQTLQLSPFFSKDLFIWLEDVTKKGESAFNAAPKTMLQAEELLLQFLYAHSSRSAKIKSWPFYRQMVK